MNLNLSTIVVIVSLGSILSSLILLMTSIFKFSVKGVSSWVVGSILNSISLLLFALQGNLNNILNYYLSNAIVICGFLFFWKGVREFVIKDKFSRYYWLLSPIMLVAVHYSFKVRIGFELRSILMALILGTITSLAGIDLYRKCASLSEKIVGGVFFSYSIFSVIKLILVFNSMKINTNLDQSFITIYTYTFSFVIIFLYTFGFLLMIGEKLQTNLHEQAVSDPLTSIYNKRGFEIFSKHHFTNSKLYGHKLFLLILDIDNFKHINDSFGHSFGDAVLCKFTEVISKNIRERDMFFRIGGEEFVILLIDIDLKTAETVAERLRRVIETTSVLNGYRNVNFTVSIGMAQLNSSDVQVSQILERADTALYKAKKTGRNNVKLALS